MAEEQDRNMLLQGSILAAAGIVTKVIGFLYRIPMANLLGNVGNGIYSVSFGIYNIALTLSSCSMPLAVSKLVSARVARDDGVNSKRVFFNALAFALAMGGIAALALHFGADALERLYDQPGLAKPLRVLSPTVFVVALLGTFRGWFQGHSNMVPTAVSQILEQLVNAVVSIVAAWQLMRLHVGDPEVNAYGAAGGTLGTLAGASVGLVFVVFLFFRTFSRRRTPQIRPESQSLLLRQLVLTIIPVVLSQTIYQIGYTLDDFVFSNVMAVHNLTRPEVSALQGVFNTQYNQMVNLPVAIATAMAASTVPGIVTAAVTGSRKATHRKITAVLKLNMVVAIPCAVGLAVLAHPIMHLLFTSLKDKETLAVHLLQTGSSAAVFYALSTITTAVLQASDHMLTPVKHCAWSLAIHVAVVFLLLRFTPLGVYGLIIGNVSFPLLVSVLNCRSLTRLLDYRWRIGRTFLIPLIASAVMGLVCWSVYSLVLRIFPMWMGLVAALLVSVLAYAYLILRLHCFSDSQLMDLPLGSRLLRISKSLE